MAGSLFTDALGGGVRVGGTLADLFQQGRDRRQLGELAKLIGAGDYQQAGAGLIGLGQVGAGLDVMQMPLKQRIAENKLQGGGVTYGKAPVYVRRPDGSLGIGVLGDDGSFKPIDGVNPAENLTKVDTGPTVGFFGTRTGQQVGNDIEKDVATPAYQETTAKEQAKIDVARPALKSKWEATMRDLERQWSVVEEDIDKAIAGVGWSTSGFVGSLLDAIPGTPAYDLSQTLKTIQGNIGFDKLQNMRDNSPTGGALGQVSNLEIQLLQAVQGALAQGQSSEQLKANLSRIGELLNQVRAEKREAFQRDFGAGGQAATYAPQSQGGMSKQQYDALPSGSVFEHNGKKYRKP